MKKLAIWGGIFFIIFGTLLHFLYQLSGDNFVVGLFAPVNESIWEHMKMVLTPMLIFSFVDYLYLKNKVKNYCFALLKQIGLPIVLIIIVFYSYTFFVGHSLLAVDILTFFVAVTFGRFLAYKIWLGKFRKLEFKGLNTLSAILLVLIFGFFIYATINPPKTGLFRDSQTGQYGADNEDTNQIPDPFGCRDYSQFSCPAECDTTCEPSTCGPKDAFGAQICTSDCGGGHCVPKSN